MGKKFLVAVDGSEQGWKAAELAVTLAKTSDAELILLHVVPEEPVPEGFEQWAEVEGVSPSDMRARYRASRSYGDVIIRDAEARARKSGLERVTSKVAEGNASAEIVGFAKAVGADMVFLGSRGLSDARGLLVGSVSHRVLHLAPCTCVLVK